MDEEIKWDQLVGIIAEHGEKYLGYVPERLAKGKEAVTNYIQACRANHGAVEFEHARFLINQLNAVTDRGQLQGLSSFTLLIPPEISKKPITMFVCPSAWYFPGDDETMCKAVVSLFENARRQEIEARAQESHLEVGGSPIILPGLRRS